MSEGRSSLDHVQPGTSQNSPHPLGAVCPATEQSSLYPQSGDVPACCTSGARRSNGSPAANQRPQEVTHVEKTSRSSSFKRDSRRFTVGEVATSGSKPRRFFTGTSGVGAGRGVPPSSATGSSEGRGITWEGIPTSKHQSSVMKFRRSNSPTGAPPRRFYAPAGGGGNDATTLVPVHPPLRVVSSAGDALGRRLAPLPSQLPNGDPSTPENNALPNAVEDSATNRSWVQPPAQHRWKTNRNSADATAVVGAVGLVRSTTMSSGRRKETADGRRREVVFASDTSCENGSAACLAGGTRKSPTARRPFVDGEGSVGNVRPGAVPNKTTFTLVPTGVKEEDQLDILAKQGMQAGYRQPLNLKLVSVALVNVFFTIAIGVFPMRADMPYRAFFYIAAAYAWGFGFYFLWQKRPRKANVLEKAYVFQEGYVYSRMVEAFVWTWLSVVFTLVFVCISLASFSFPCDSQDPQPGCRGYLWIMPWYCSLPMALAWDQITSTDAFRAAAATQGYTAMKKLHLGFYFHYVVLAFHASFFSVLWMFGAGPLGVYSQAGYDMYLLYAIDLAYILQLVVRLPRFTAACMYQDSLPRYRSLSISKPRTGPEQPGPLVAAAKEAFAEPEPPEDGQPPVAQPPATAAGSPRQTIHGDLPPPGGRALLAPVLDYLSEAAANLAGLPQGLRLLVRSVQRAVLIFWRDWRWMVATRPAKCMYAMGFMGVGIFGLPTADIRLDESYVSLAVNLTMLIAINVVNFLCSVYAIVADEEMILRAASDGKHIGSGLVFSTASLLNALTTGQPVACGYVATEERIMASAAISCRWDESISWTLQVKQTDGSVLDCSIMVSKMQLYRSLVVAWRDKCRYVWMDTISLPQHRRTDSPEQSERKDQAMAQLLPAMTSVYATSMHVIVVDTERGLEENENKYQNRTWTLQESVMNRRTSRVHMEGGLTMVHNAFGRAKLAGVDLDLLSQGVTDLSTYKWVLSSQEREAARNTSLAQRMDFPVFAMQRNGAVSLDKAIALGQIMFQVLFENTSVAYSFMQEVALLIADSDPSGDDTTLLLDNTGWDEDSMSGSGDLRRVLLGRPGYMETGPKATWHFRHVPVHGIQETYRKDSLGAHPFIVETLVKFQDPDVESSQWDRHGRGTGPENSNAWLLGMLEIRKTPVPVAVLPSWMERDNLDKGAGDGAAFVGVLLQLRTCTAQEREAINDCDALEAMDVTWL